jgi:putative molybdopterin biosynthesis protein
MKPPQTSSFLREIRRTRGLSAAELARSIRVSRQTIYSIEDGTFVPNTSVALQLARALDVRVEDLFALQGVQTPEQDAELLSGSSQILAPGQPVRVSRVNGRTVAIPVPLRPAYLPAADAVVHSQSAKHLSLAPPAHFGKNREPLVLAGCDPALSLAAELLTRSGLELIPIPCSSRCALKWLREGRVHVAGSHLLDRSSGDYNVPFIKRLLPSKPRLVTFAIWEHGLVLARGNPKGIRTIADLANRRVRLINREEGSGSRNLLDQVLQANGMIAEQIRGYDVIAAGHLDAASAVAVGSADCCIATSSAARFFGLEFVSLATERFDLSFSESSLELPAAKALLDLLNSSHLHQKLQAIAGYDTTHTGRVLM